MGDLVSYYRERASEYERVYDKPERRADLERLHEIVPEFLAGRRVLEIACGTVHAAIVGAGGQRPVVEALTYFWYATYLTSFGRPEHARAKRCFDR